MGVKIVDTVLRDGHQSLFATRMNTEEVLLALKELDQVGYHALEVWGGATFDACLRFLNEDPWERLRKIRKVCKNTKLQMLFRGQNILGYRHYADDVVEKFVEKSIKNGIDIIRIFDALNDLRNLEAAVKATKKYGGECQIALSYTTSPASEVEYNNNNRYKSLLFSQGHVMQVAHQQERVVHKQEHVMMEQHHELMDMQVVMHDVNTHGIIII